MNTWLLSLADNIQHTQNREAETSGERWTDMVGRPTKYDPAFCDVAEKTLGEGFSLAVLAGDCDVCLDTIHEWVKQHPDFSDAVKRGRAKGARVWEGRLRDLAEKNEGNVTAVIFGLKNRIPAEWKDKTETEHSGGVTVTKIERTLVRPQNPNG